MNAEEILNRLDRAIDELHVASKAAFELAKQIAKDTEARLTDDDDWCRMPRRKERSEGGWSLRKLQMEIKAGHVRKKMVVGYPYYSAADVRRVISS